MSGLPRTCGLNTPRLGGSRSTALRTAALQLPKKSLLLSGPIVERRLSIVAIHTNAIPLCARRAVALGDTRTRRISRQPFAIEDPFPRARYQRYARNQSHISNAL